jgi:hypothetical protein
MSSQGPQPTGIGAGAPFAKGCTLRPGKELVDVVASPDPRHGDAYVRRGLMLHRSQASETLARLTRSNPRMLARPPRNYRRIFSGHHWATLGCLVTLLVASGMAVTAPPATAVPNPFKALGAVRKAWKQSPEARFAVKVLRKSTTKAIGDWRTSSGWSCAWRSVWPTYCRNGTVEAAVAIEFSISTPYGRTSLGRVEEGTLLSAACVSRAPDRSVRVLWPTPRTPSVFVRQALLRPFLGVPADLPWC